MLLVSQWDCLAGQRAGCRREDLEGGHIRLHPTCLVARTARAKGYKTEDSFADRLGHGEQRNGQAITAVFDPEADSDTAFLVCFANVQEAAEYLRWKRAKCA